MVQRRDPDSQPPSVELRARETPTAEQSRAEPPRRLTDREKVVRAFIRDGRLVSIPAKPSKRDLLLPVILDRCFPEDRPFEETEVNRRLALVHSDVAALRRYLVDGGWMTRHAGSYRRTRTMAQPTESGTTSGPSDTERASPSSR
jgi:hypothetical protein